VQNVNDKYYPFGLLDELLHSTQKSFAPSPGGTLDDETFGENFVAVCLVASTIDRFKLLGFNHTTKAGLQPLDIECGAKQKNMQLEKLIQNYWLCCCKTSNPTWIFDPIIAAVGGTLS
jgi:hypothetical protein